GLPGETSAPLRPADGSYFETPFAIAYRKTCPQVCRSRLAVSSTPRFSTFFRTSRSSGAPISATGLGPKSGKTSASRRARNKAEYLGARRRRWRLSLPAQLPRKCYYLQAWPLALSLSLQCSDPCLRQAIFERPPDALGRAKATLQDKHR